MEAMRTATAATAAEDIMDMALGIMATTNGQAVSGHGDRAAMEA
jgi:hypothetical protein